MCRQPRVGWPEQGSVTRTSRRREASAVGTTVTGRSTAYGGSSGKGSSSCQSLSPRLSAVGAAAVRSARHSQRTRRAPLGVHRHTARTVLLRPSAAGVGEARLQSWGLASSPSQSCPYARINPAQLASTSKHEALVKTRVHLQEPARARAAARAARALAVEARAAEGSEALEALYRPFFEVRHHALQPHRRGVMHGLGPGGVLEVRLAPSVRMRLRETQPGSLPLAQPWRSPFHSRRISGHHWGPTARHRRWLAKSTARTRSQASLPSRPPLPLAPPATQLAPPDAPIAAATTSSRLARPARPRHTSGRNGPPDHRRVRSPRDPMSSRAAQRRGPSAGRRRAHRAPQIALRLVWRRFLQAPPPRARGPPATTAARRSAAFRRRWGAEMLVDRRHGR